MLHNLSLTFNEISINFDRKNKKDNLTIPKTIDIQTGKKILIIGKSGSGKSIFLKCIAGLLDKKHVKLNGTININNKSMEFSSYKNYKNIVKKIFGKHATMIHQDAINHLHPYRNIARQIGECCFDKKNLQKKIVEVCHQVGLVPLITNDKIEDDKFYYLLKSIKRSNLSGGMCQRVSLASLLIQNPALIFMDEPFSDIDVSSRQTLKNLIIDRSLLKKNSCLLMATHDVDIIKNVDMFSKILLVKNCEISEVNKIPEEWYNCTLKAKNSINSKLKDDIILYSNNNIKYKYSNAMKYAVNMERSNMSFKLKRNEHTGIVGETGSGKSTLARLIAYLIRDSSEIFITNINPNNKHILLRKLNNRQYKNIQVVFQDSLGTINRKETISSIIKRLQRKRYFDNDLVYDNFEKIGLSFHTIDKFTIDELSMGMLRRFLLVKAFLGLYPINEQDEPKILILDELTRGLDPINRQKVFKYLSYLKGVTCVIISHDLDFIGKFCKRIIVMYKGLIVEEKFASNNGDCAFPLKKWQHPYSKKLWNKEEIELQPGIYNIDSCNYYPYCISRNIDKCLEKKNIIINRNSLNNGWYYCIKGNNNEN